MSRGDTDTNNSPTNRRDTDMNGLINSIPDAEKYMGVSRSVVYSLIASGHLKRVKIGRRAFITRESMDNYLAQLTDA